LGCDIGDSAAYVDSSTDLYFASPNFNPQPVVCLPNGGFNLAFAFTLYTPNKSFLLFEGQVV
jgi:hypothetical protein